MNFTSWEENAEFRNLWPILSGWFGTELENQLRIVHHESTGLSGSRIWRVEYRGNQHCLRRWPPGQTSRNHLQTIHKLIEHIWQAGLQVVPVPSMNLRGTTIVMNDGYWWELSDWLPGTALIGRTASEAQRHATLKILAKFHQAAESFDRQCPCPKWELAPGLLLRHEILQSLSTGQLAKLSEAVSNDAPSLLRSTLRELLDQLDRVCRESLTSFETCVSTPLPLQWCLRDAHPGNFLMTGNQVTGIVDFGAAAIDSVAGDLARLLGSFDCTTEELFAGLKVYKQNRALLPEEQRAICAYHWGGLVASAANWIRWLAIEHSVPVTETTRARLVVLIEQLRNMQQFMV